MSRSQSSRHGRTERLASISKGRFVPLALASSLAVFCLVLPPHAATAWAADGKVAAVNIDNFTFTPPVLTIAVGTTVTWTNRDDIPHTVVENDRNFRSAAIDTDEQFSHKFNTPGEINYFCSLHPHMTGKIVVKP